ncbi:probable RNA exonuclease NGL2 [Zygosaccharomyces bailii]|nr:probable RNA exonuclease NGL2 [Zygosaccharomyces bailii]
MSNENSAEKVAKDVGRKKGKKGKKIPVSPEHIAKVRAEREAARAAKREAMLAKGVDPECPPELQFIKRPILQLHEDEPIKSFTFSLMSYNCLAQALIRRKLFPTSGDALKWYRRSQVLLNEFKHYNADVICLQEIDYIQFRSFWKEELAKLGYGVQFHRQASKNHGVAIAWKENLFTLTDKMLIDFDKELSGDIPPRTTTNNAGLLLSLKFSGEVIKKYGGNKSGIIVGTTHLFWHPFGTFERTRQCYVVLKKIKEFLHRVNVLQNDNDGDISQWHPFFCGDFNSQPFDAPYLSMTSKPIEYTGRAKRVIECSTSYTFSKMRDGEEDADEEGGNIEKYGTGQPEHPVPDSYHAKPNEEELVRKMQDLHNSLDMRAISLYAVGYRKVHPENSSLDNDRGEPEISNWANTWRGLLDYMFYVRNWDFSDHKAVDSLESFEAESGIRIRGLLRMPPAKEMTEHGQPHEGEYPSDHLCILCNLELVN